MGLKMKWNVNAYNKNASFVSQHGQGVLLLLEPKPKECILDLGCGNGELAEKIFSKGCEVVGIDSSKEMIVAAQKRGIDAHVTSGEKMSYQNRFDAVFSNAALHWMKNADCVIQNVYQALKMGGRFCAEMGGEGNVQTIVSQIYKQLETMGLNGDTYNPWFFPSKKIYTLKLEQAGFRIEYIETFDRRTQLPTDVAGWLETFADPFLQEVPKSEYKTFINTVKEFVSDELKNEDGKWFADYVRLRFLAYKI